MEIDDAKANLFLEKRHFDSFDQYVMSSAKQMKKVIEENFSKKQLKSLMGDRAEEMKISNLNIKGLLREDVTIHVLYRNTHFLIGLTNAI